MNTIEIINNGRKIKTDLPLEVDGVIGTDISQESLQIPDEVEQ